MKAWKWVGLAGIAGVAAAGVVSARKRRAWDEADTDQIRTRLRDRLEETAQNDAGASGVQAGGE